MAGNDDDTTKDPLLSKNVPRRPRSAALWPRKDEPDGDEPDGISAKKKHRLVLPIEEPEPKANDHGGIGILGGMPPALLSHKDKADAATAAPASSASSSEAEPDIDWAENERCRKGKTPVVNEYDGACAAVARRPLAGTLMGDAIRSAVPRRPLAGTLMGDAIRSHGSTAVAGSFKPPSGTPTKPKKPRTKPRKPAKKKDRSKPKNKEKDRGAWFWCGMGRDGMSSAGSGADYSFDRIGVVRDRLRTTLRGLGVAAPERVYGKLLTRCDRNIQQARLLMSWKRRGADGAKFPLCAFLTVEERGKAHVEGLPITAYDRGGDAYELTFRFLGSNGAYRLIYKWGDFLRHNGLVVAKDEPAPVDDDVMLDLWMFRPPGPVGKVGMVMLHYRRGDAAHADAALDEVQQKRLQLMLNNGDAAAADAVMEDVVRDANEDAGVMCEVAAAAAPASPSEPSGGGDATEAAEAASSSPSESDGAGAKEAEEQAAGAPGKVADTPSSTSSELHGGAGRSNEVTAPLSLGAGGDGTDQDEKQEAGGALMVMVLEVEAAATQSSLDHSNAGGAANEVAAPPSSTEAGEGDKVVEAAARSWNRTKYEFEAAQGLLMLSRDNSSIPSGPRG